MQWDAEIRNDITSDGEDLSITVDQFLDGFQFTLNPEQEKAFKTF